MLLQQKHRKRVQTVWIILSVFLIISLVGFYSLPFLFQ